MISIIELTQSRPFERSKQLFILLISRRYIRVLAGLDGTNKKFVLSVKLY